jgi:hypothetical protein
MQRQISFERRERIRLPLELKARCALMAGRITESVGTTVNISSRGALVAFPQPIPRGTQLDIRLEWPIGPGTPPHRPRRALEICGTVVRSEGKQVAVKFEKHAFVHVLVR